MRIKTIFVIALFTFCAAYAQAVDTSSAPIAVTITMAKTTYAAGEKLDFEIRIENVSDDTVRIPKKVDSSYLPQMYDAGGQFVPWEYAIIAADFFDEDNTVELAPGCFYGQKCRRWYLPHRGKFTFHIRYLSPRNFGGFLACYWEGEVESNKVVLITEEQNPKVMMKTELGDIILEVYEDRAPVTAGNFLKLVDENRFTGAAFYRVVTMDNQPDDSIKIEVIQGGLWLTPVSEYEGDGVSELPPIEHETTIKTGVRHKDGVISMARAAPGTASSEFFICIGDQPELDFGGRRNPDGQGFAAFGRVIKGMDVVREIQKQPNENQMLLEPVKIEQVKRQK